MKILIASPVYQKKEILSSFLLSLTQLNQEDLLVSYLFIDDNTDVISSNLLSSFVSLHGGTVLPAPKKIARDDDPNTSNRLKWNDELIWHVARMRNTIMDYAHNHNYDYLFMTDTDLILQPQTLQHLVAAQKDLISEVFWTDWRESDFFSMTDIQNRFPQVWDNGQFDFADPNLNDEDYRREGIKWLKRLLQPGVYSVGGLGACTLFSSNVLRSDLRYIQVQDLNLRGEDRHFSVLAQRKGFTLWADTHAEPLHVFSTSEIPKIHPFCTSIYKTDKQRRLYLASVISKIILSYNYTVETPDIKEYLSEKMNLRYTKKQSQTHKKFSSHELIISIYIHSAQYISQTQVEIFGIKHTTNTKQDSLNLFRGIVSLQETCDEIRIEKLDLFPL